VGVEPFELRVTRLREGRERCIPAVIPRDPGPRQRQSINREGVVGHMAGNSSQPLGKTGGGVRDAAASEGSTEGLSESLLRPAERERSMSSGRSPEPVARQGSASAIASFVRSVSMKLRGKEDQKQVFASRPGQRAFH